MADTIPDLWPDNIGVKAQSPYAILAVQAEQLRIKTKGLLLGRLSKATANNQDTLLSFEILAPVLPFQLTLFTAAYTKDLAYPATITIPERMAQSDPAFQGKQTIICRSETYFKNSVKLILNSTYTRSVLDSIMDGINGSTGGTPPARSPRATR